MRHEVRGIFDIKTVHRSQESEACVPQELKHPSSKHLLHNPINWRWFHLTETYVTAVTVYPFQWTCAKHCCCCSGVLFHSTFSLAFPHFPTFSHSFPSRERIQRISNRIARSKQDNRSELHMKRGETNSKTKYLEIWMVSTSVPGLITRERKRWVSLSWNRFNFGRSASVIAFV